MLPQTDVNYLTLVSQVLGLKIITLIEDLLPERLFTELSFEQRQAVWKLVWEAVQGGERSIYRMRDIVNAALLDHDVSVSQGE